MTGAVPSSVPKPTVTIMNAAAHAKGFIVTSSGLSGNRDVHLSTPTARPSGGRPARAAPAASR